MAWAAETNIKGPKGDKGDPGTPGLSGAATCFMSDTPPVGKPPGSLWVETDTGYLYFYYDDGTSSQWVMASPGSGGISQADADLRYVNVTGDTMTGALALPTLPQADKSTSVPTTAWVKAWAAPFDALAYSGMQINGSMEVSQERGAGGTTASASHICDVYRMSYAGTMVMSGAQFGAIAGGFSNCVGMQAATAQASLGTGHFAIISHRIEGYRLARVWWGAAAAQPITIAFWTGHTMAGIYSVAIRNSALNRYYVTTYTQIAGGASEYKTVTIPGDVAGVWDKTNGFGLELIFTMACGPDLTTAAPNVWSATAAFAATGQVNAVVSTTNSFLITGLVVLPGIEAPSAARSPLIMRPYDQELLTCRRYWEQVFVPIIQHNATGFPITFIPFQTQKRATPTSAFVVAPTYSNGSSAASIYSVTGSGVSIIYTSPTANGAISNFSFNADARL